jgi:NAD(P)-dependent dehydrogenase (short-subunit alcohol dehydrogenase family)
LGRYDLQLSHADKNKESRMDCCTVVTGAAGGIGRAVAEKLPAARWITGQSLVCDGGHSLG